MKTSFVILASIALALPSHAAFAKWTNKEGKTVEMELVEVTAEGDETVGVFVMRNGRKVTLKKTMFSEESAKQFDAMTPKTSVFNEVLEGNMVILDGDKFKDHKLVKKPKKFYIFYYTASWCGPCKAFTPQLADFYNKNKNENFELVLISSDRDQKSMESYAAKNKMPWPQLKFAKIGTFSGKFNHGVNGIPSVIVCDLEGKIVTNDGRDLNALEQLVK
jgi:thiol-disulfide isomerase/thioredoxin